MLNGLKVLVDPTHQFDRVRHLPISIGIKMMAMIVVAQCLALAFYFYMVDMTWLGNYMLADAPLEQRAAVAKMLSPKVISITTIIGTVVGIAVWLFLVFGYFYFVDRFTGGRDRLTNWFNFVILSYIPLALIFPITVLNLLLSDTGQVPPASLDTTSLNALFSGFRSGRWLTLSSSLSFLQIWPIVLQAIGLVRWTGRSATAAAFVALTPTAAFYIGWALIVLFRS